MSRGPPRSTVSYTLLPYTTIFRSLMAADLVFFVGCRAGSVTTERWRFPEPGRTRILHLDSDPQVIGASYPTEVALVGDAKLGLAAIAAVLDRKSTRLNSSP